MDFQTQAQEFVAEALVVIRVEVKERFVVRDGFVGAAGVREQSGQRGPRPHVGAGFEEAPEVAAVLLEELRTERLFAERHYGGDVLDPLRFAAAL